MNEPLGPTVAPTLDDEYAHHVLGLKGFRAAKGPAAIPLVVECEVLDAGARALLHKILGSVSLTTWAQIKPGEAVTDPIRHHLRFLGEKPYGRAATEGGAVWNLPKLSDMAGTGAHVSEVKKVCWTVLQNFKQEWRPS